MDKKPLHILIINWRSIRSTLAGGAETATYEHARRWVSEKGAEVTWISPKYKKKVVDERIDGINFKYVGISLSGNVFQLLFSYPLFYFLVFITYLTTYRNVVDIVIDQVHGFPYLTPFYVKQPIIVYVHEVAGDIWDKMFKFPINKIGKFIEKLIFLPYKKATFVCVSESTKQDILNLNIPEENVYIVGNGISNEFVKSPLKKESKLTIMFLNRVVKMKGIERALEVFAIITKKNPYAKFWIVGNIDKYYKEYLHHRCVQLRIDKSVKFFGRVPESKKIEMLTRSHVLINPSFKEGWGLVNLEANSRGTPAVAFSVNGNVDSIVSGVNGYLVKDGDLKTMASKIIQASKDENLRVSALTYAKDYNWDSLANTYYQVLNSKII